MKTLFYALYVFQYFELILHTLEIAYMRALKFRNNWVRHARCCACLKFTAIFFVIVIDWQFVLS